MRSIRQLTEESFKGYQSFIDDNGFQIGKIKKFNYYINTSEGFLFGYYGYMDILRNFIDGERVGLFVDFYNKTESSYDLESIYIDYIL